VNVTNVAKAQRSISGSNTSGFASPTAQLNAGAAFSLILSKGNGPTPTKVFSQGTADPGTKSTATLTFAAMAKGESVAVNGLTFTANKALTASEVGIAFANLNGTTAATLNTSTMATFGTFAGQFNSSYTSGSTTTNVLVLTSAANGAQEGLIRYRAPEM
jgi:S-layer protein